MAFSGKALSGAGGKPNGHSQGSSSGDDLDELLGDDSLSGAVEGQCQLVNHLGYGRGRNRRTTLDQTYTASPRPAWGLDTIG